MEKPPATTDDAPRCPSCGYVLLGLPEFRCPECGTSFDPEYLDASFRLHLLPWERPEAGGRLRRLARTLLEASLHPGRFFTSLGLRKERRIHHAGGLITACLLAALCFRAAGFLVSVTESSIRSLVRSGQPSRAVERILEGLSMVLSLELLFAIQQMLSALLSVVVMAVLIGRLFREKLGSLRSLDIAAAYIPAVSFGAFILALARVTVAVSPGTRWVAMYGGALASMVVPLLLLWFTCRRLLSLSRWRAVGMLIIGGVVEFGCGAAVAWPFGRLLQVLLT